jgi:hypothetical protein
VEERGLRNARRAGRHRRGTQDYEGDREDACTREGNHRKCIVRNAREKFELD